MIASTFSDFSFRSTILDQKLQDFLMLASAFFIFLLIAWITCVRTREANNAFILRLVSVGVYIHRPI